MEKILQCHSNIKDCHICVFDVDVLDTNTECEKYNGQPKEQFAFGTWMKAISMPKKLDIAGTKIDGVREKKNCKKDLKW